MTVYRVSWKDVIECLKKAENGDIIIVDERPKLYEEVNEN